MIGKLRFVTFGALTVAVLSALLLSAAHPVHAQTETVLYNFTGGSDGADPKSLLTSDGAGNFYGTTRGGGLGYGTVFELSPNGNGGWNETVLYSFCPAPNLGCPDGAFPAYAYVIFDSAGNLYGTAYNGGANQSNGVVFKLSHVGANWTETVLYNFCSQAGCADGAGPTNGLIMDAAGNLYGTTCSSGCPPQGGGTVFELSPSGGGWTEQVIYNNFQASWAGLTIDVGGNIFGVGYSTVFELSPNGKGGWTPTVIHTFAGGPKDGSNPQGTPVSDKAGNLYGTTDGGGAKGYGTVYKLSYSKKKGWTEKILYSFKGGKKDGINPFAGIMLDAIGNIYGTTATGGGKYNAGTVYELVAPVGKGGYKEKVLWSFNGADGSLPTDSLILNSGHLYGTAEQGGSSGNGVVFEVTP